MKDKQVATDAVKFGLVGAINTAIDFAIISLAQLAGLSIFWSICVGYVTGGVNGYILNNKWTYKRHNQPLRVSDGAKYVAISFIGLALTELIVYVATTKLGYSIFTGKIIAVVTVFSWNFFANRFVTFHNPGSQQVPDLTIPIE